MTCKDCEKFESCAGKSGVTRYYDNVLICANVEVKCQNFKNDKFQYNECLKILDRLIKYLPIIRNAVEKRLPTELLPENKYFGNGKCPQCSAVFIDRSTKYCGHCGQRLDWGEDNDNV